MLNADIKEVVITEGQLEDKIAEIGKAISDDYIGKELVFISILKGSVIFTADLMREVSIPCSVDFMEISSYGCSTVSSGEIKVVKDLSCSIENKHVIIVEDILDSGLTLKYLVAYLKTKNPASVEIACLLNKKEGENSLKYMGFKAPHKFLVGYGLDFAEKYRNLPYIGVLKEEIYQ